MRRTPIRTMICLAIAGLATPAIASADLTNISDGTNSFQWNPDDGTHVLGATFDDNYMTEFGPMLRYRRPDSLAIGGGELTTLLMADSSIVDIVLNSAANFGDNGTQHVDFGFREFTNTIDLFDVDFSFAIATDGAGNSILHYSMTLENVSGGDVREVQLFSFLNMDLINASNSGIDFQAGGFTGFLQRVNPSFGDPLTDNAFHGTDNFQNWEVNTSSILRDKLLVAGGNLINGGTPYAMGDMGSALGWNLGTMSAGQVFSVNLVIRSIPEPAGGLLLTGLLCGAGGFGRRRRKDCA